MADNASQVCEILAKDGGLSNFRQQDCEAIPAVDGTFDTQILSFIPKGMPARGPGSSPAESCSSICLACQARIHLIPLKTREAGSEADLQQSCIYLM